MEFPTTVEGWTEWKKDPRNWEEWAEWRKWMKEKGFGEESTNLKRLQEGSNI
jgi:hypothetical protein